MDTYIKNSTRYSTDPNDFILIKGDQVPVPEYTFFDKKVQYYQPEVHKLSCSLHACFTAISNNFGIEFTLEERKTVLDMAIDRGFDTSWGWYMSKAVHLLRDYCRDHKNLDLVYFRIHFTQFEQMAKAGFGVVTGYKYRVGMGPDRNDNGILGEDIEFYGSTGGGHLLCYTENEVSKKHNLPGGFVDSYYPRHKHNQFGVVNLAELVQAGTIFEHGYIYTYGNPVKKGYNTLSLDQKIEKLRNR